MARLPARSAEAVAEAARALFADERWVDRLIADLAAQMRADPFFVPPFRAMSGELHSGLILFEDAHMSVAAGVTRVAELAPADRETLWWSGIDNMSRVNGERIMYGKPASGSLRIRSSTRIVAEGLTFTE